MLFTACAPTTTLEAGWTTPAVRAHPAMTRVVTLFVSDTVAVRRSGEEHLAADLARHGVVASPAYAVLSDDDAHALAVLGHQETPATAAAKDKLRAQGYDGVVTMRIVDREKNLEYSPPAYVGWGPWGSPYWNYWDYPDLYGYAYTKTTYRIETNAYSLDSNQIVWSGLVKSVDPSSARALVDESAQVVAGQLSKRKLAG